MAFRLPFPRLRKFLLLGVVGVVVVSVGLYLHHSRHAEASDGAAVVSYTGVADIRFGQSSAELTGSHGLHMAAADCLGSFTSPSNVKPVFVDDRLVLLWLEPPTATPEGIRVGSTVAEVRRAYPKAAELSPPGPYEDSGIMVSSGDMAYLFLYGEDTVRKAIVGYRSYAQQFFDSGSNAC